jgi:hypothetical protein
MTPTGVPVGVVAFVWPCQPSTRHARLFTLDARILFLMSLFTLAIVGDRRLGVAHYRFLRSTLDRLLATRLPAVRVLTGGGQGRDVLIERWAEEHGLAVERFPGGHDYRTEGMYRDCLIQCQPDGLVVFDSGKDEPGELVRRARTIGVAVRIVEVQFLLLAKR